jgi:sodium transport system permease protein
MKLSSVGLVYAKELRETLRDRRTLAVMILFPLVVYPLISLTVTQVMVQKATKSARHVSRVAVTGPALEAEVVRLLLRKSPADFAVQSGGADAEVESAVLDALVVVDGALPRAPAPAPAPSPAPAPRSLHLVFDETRDESSRARERLEHFLGSAFPARCQPVFALHDRSIAPQAKVGGYLLSKILPLIVVVMVMIGAFYPAIDITAGERERGTLETILSSPVGRFELMTGKVLAVTTLAAITGTLNLASMSITVLEGIKLAGAKEMISIPWTRALATLLTIFPSAFLFASVMVAIGAMARSFKEAQNLLTPVYFLCVAPAIIAALGEIDLRGAALIAPAMNVTLLARDLMLGNARPAAALVVIGSTLFYGALALSVAARLYDSERMLYADDTQLSLRQWLRRLVLGGAEADAGGAGAAMQARDGGGGGPTAGQALLLFGVAYVLLFFVLFPLQARHLVSGLLISEWAGMLGLVVIYARLAGRPLRQVIQLRRPSARALLGAALIGLSAWAAIGQLADWISPAPQELVESLRREIAPPGGQRGLLVTLLLMALTPAICEEALFRGPILRGLRSQLSPLAAAVVTGLLFGVFHVDVWRVIPTGLLGVILSLIALRTGSIAPAMLTHFLNNACLVTLTQLGLEQKMVNFSQTEQIGMFVSATLLLGLGGWLVRGAGRPPAR